MSIKEIKQFLRDRPGYLKEGQTRLAIILEKQFGKEVDKDFCAEAIRKVREELRGSIVVIEEKKTTVDTSGLELKSMWQNAAGEWLKSYRALGGMLEIDKEDFILEALKDFRKYSPQPFKPRSPYKTGDCLVEISLPDLHIGKFNPEEQRQDAIDCVNTLLSRLPSSARVDRFLLPVGNDLLNSDTNSGYTTTKGTPQFDVVEYQESFRRAWQLMVDIAERLAEIAPVDIVVVPGNHDEARAFYVGEVISAYFGANPNVSVDNEISFRKYYNYGATLIGFTHGDKEKPADLTTIMARERKKDYAYSEYTEWHLGHIHKEMTLLKIVDDIQSTKIRFLPSICDEDTWHKSMGYNSLRDSHANVYSKTEGHIAIANARLKSKQ